MKDNGSPALEYTRSSAASNHPLEQELERTDENKVKESSEVCQIFDRQHVSFYSLLLH